MLPSALNTTITQDDFAKLVGVSQQRVAQMVAEGLLQREGTAAQWLLAYCERLREHAAGRDRELTIERAGLTREQRIGQAIKNAVAQGQYAPIGLLADVLATAAAAVVDRMDQLPAQLRVACPDLPSEARDAIARTLASARNEWIRSTAELAVRRLDELADVEEPEPDPPADEAPE